MCVSVKSQFALRRFCGRRGLLFVVLLFVVTLVFSCFTFTTFSSVSPFVSGNSDKIVSTETELREAINNAPTKKTYTIALNNDIILTDSSLIIPTNKDIILTSNKAEDYYKLIGDIHVESGHPLDWSHIVRVNTITVNDKGLLTLDGIGVTCKGSSDYAITVNKNGQFIMHKGLISNHFAGVDNMGVFLMYGGEISGNMGGVVNSGVFRLFGGKIIDNKIADMSGGSGVSNEGTFEMFGGEISYNIATFCGGGVRNAGSFTLSGGIISGNMAYQGGGGVYNLGVFIMREGLISDNNVIVRGGGIGMGVGGGVNNGGRYAIGNFEMFGGEIFGNTAEKGGGVYNFFNSTVSLMGSGVISGNTAELGGGVCMDHDFTMSGGEISGNTAQVGNDVYVGNGVFKLTGGKISGNTFPSDDDVYVGNGVFEQVDGEISDDVGDVLICMCIVAVVVTVAIVVTGLFLCFKKKEQRGKNNRLVNVECSE